MTIVDTSKITSKGQVTIPNRIREILHLKKGCSVAFGIAKDGVVLLPCEITVKSPYSVSEWAKIEKLAQAKGKTYNTAKEAKRHIENI